MSQGSSEVSIMFVVNKDQEKQLLKPSTMPFSVKVGRLIMAQSLNKTVLLNTTGTSYLSIAGKVGKFLSEIRLWNFTQMSMSNNLSRFLGAPYQPNWSQCHWSQNQSPLRSLHRQRKIPLCLKRLRCHSQNCSRKTRQRQGRQTSDLIQTIGQKFKNLFAKSRNFSIIIATDK